MPCFLEYLFSWYIMVAGVFLVSKFPFHIYFRMKMVVQPKHANTQGKKTHRMLQSLIVKVLTGSIRDRIQWRCRYERGNEPLSFVE
jgi:hypothetical protein